MVGEPPSIGAAPTNVSREEQLLRLLRMCRTIAGEPTIGGSRTIAAARPTSPLAADRRTLEEHTATRYDELMACVASSHAPEFATVDVTMAQMKALYLVASRGSLHISALADLLGVTLSTGSGLADRLVDQGLMERRHDEADRRHVIVRVTDAGTVLLERMRELGTGRVRSLLGGLDDADLVAFERILGSFVAQIRAESPGHSAEPLTPPTVATQLVAVGLFLSGLFAWGQLQQELLPDIQLPIVTVIAALPGASAQDVATQVTGPIEQALANVPRLETTQSTSANSLSLVVAQFSYGTNLKETLSTINTQLATASLPDNVTPRVTALNINDQPVVIATIGPAPGADPVEAATLARTVVAPEIRSLEGVSSADLSGGATSLLRITLDPKKMADAGIPLSQVQGVIQANQIALPAGTITDQGVRLPISAEHRFTSVAELNDLIVGAKGMPAAGGTSAPGGTGAPTGGTGTTGTTPTTTTGIPQLIHLGDIATITLDSVQQSGYARTNGEPSLTLTVSKASGANTVDVADEVNAAFASIQKAHPGVVQITVIQDLSTFIKESRDGLVREGLLGAFFAVITIFLFLLSLRTTLVAAVSIPLSILIALTIMGIGGLTINIITLGGLAVAVGRVVDDSIVVLENIYRHRARGE